MPLRVRVREVALLAATLVTAARGWRARHQFEIGRMRELGRRAEPPYRASKLAAQFFSLMAALGSIGPLENE